MKAHQIKILKRELVPMLVNDITPFLSKVIEKRLNLFIDEFIKQRIEQMNEEQKLEQKIIEKGLTAPRVTPDQIDACIKAAQYYVFPGTTLTVCCLHLANGYTVTGESACASPENFDEEVGKEVAYNQARSKIWALEGYALRNALMNK